MILVRETWRTFRSLDTNTIRLQKNPHVIPSDLEVHVPTYVYESIARTGETPERFEFEQRMSDPQFTHHPETGVSLRRVLTAPAIIGVRSSMREAAAREKDVSIANKDRSSETHTLSESESPAAHHCSDCDGGH